MFSRYSQALLRVDRACQIFVGFTQKNRFELIHSGVSEHDTWIIVGHHWRRARIGAVSSKKIRCMIAGSPGECAVWCEECSCFLTFP